MRPCGTNAAYNRHIINREKPDEACLEAHRQYRATHRKRVYLNRGNLRVSPLGTQRRIRALMRMGYRGEDIAAVAVPHLKSGSRWVYALMDPELKSIHRSSYDAIARAYEAMSHIPGPSQKARTMALNKGWAPPLAWDDIDDPDCKPEGYLRPCEIRKIKNGRA